MTCTDMLTLLLDAEPEELRGGSSVVAVHVRDRLRCRAVARRWVAETLILTAHVLIVDDYWIDSARSPESRRARPLVWAGGLVATAIIVMLLTPRAKPDVPAHVEPPLAANAEPAPQSIRPPTAIRPLPSRQFAKASAAVQCAPFALRT